MSREETELAPMPSDDADKKAAKQNGMQLLDVGVGRRQTPRTYGDTRGFCFSQSP
jgi:hypothetical protein